MTGEEMATQFRNLVDDDFDTTHMYQLLSQAKNYVERTEKPEILKTMYSVAASAGDSYTNPKALPSDFRTFVKLSLDRLKYTLCRFEDQVLYRNSARRAFINLGANTFAPTAPISTSGTWYLFYFKKTPDFTEDNEEDSVCLWPDEFQPLIPYQAAKIYQANIDADAIAFRMSAEQEAEYERLLAAFRAWDHDLKTASMDGRTGFDTEEDDIGIDIGLM